MFEDGVNDQHVRELQSVMDGQRRQIRCEGRLVRNCDSVVYAPMCRIVSRGNGDS